MTDEAVIRDIIEHKLMGYQPLEIHRILSGRMKISVPTVYKYYRMDSVPADLHEKLKKKKAFDSEPFHEAVISILASYPSGTAVCAASVYDSLEEMFIENGSYDKLPASLRSLQDYVKCLLDEGLYEGEKKKHRIYHYVDDTKPGDQMLVDFGEVLLASGQRIYFLCLLLRYSRFLYVFPLDHRFNSQEACAAMYRCFLRIGGRPSRLVIDQDAVFVASETYGEVIETRVFADFLKEQDIALFTCNKADPESKGPVENSVKYVKSSFFNSRLGRMKDLADVRNSLPGWQKRSNSRIHHMTYRKPAAVLEDEERSCLRPLVPSHYDTAPGSYVEQTIGDMPYVRYNTCSYSVPDSYCRKKVKFKITGSRIHIYETGGNHICSHVLSTKKGSKYTLDEHRKKDSDRKKILQAEFGSRWDNPYLQAFMSGLSNRFPRHWDKQIRQIMDFLEDSMAERDMVTKVMRECCDRGLISLSDFITFYGMISDGRLSPADDELPPVYDNSELDIYEEAFRKRL